MRHFSAPRILYIDSNHQGSRHGSSSSLLRTLRQFENSANYRVSIADALREALELIASEPFDLFILRHCLSEMSGIELCRRIRQTDKRTPILFFGGRTRRADGDVSLAAGATEYLVEPVNEEHLIGTVRRLLRDFQCSKLKNQPACGLAK